MTLLPALSRAGRLRTLAKPLALGLVLSGVGPGIANEGLVAFLRLLRGSNPETFRLLYVLTSAGLLAPAGWVTCRAPACRVLWLSGLWICVILLVYKTVWEHHYVFLVPWFALLAREAADGGWRSRAGRLIYVGSGMAFLALAVPSPFVPYLSQAQSAAFAPGPAALLHHLWKPLPCLVLFIVLCTGIYKSRHEPGAERPGPASP